jgi:hypothetical protein
LAIKTSKEYKVKVRDTSMGWILGNDGRLHDLPIWGVFHNIGLGFANVIWVQIMKNMVHMGSPCRSVLKRAPTRDYEKTYSPLNIEQTLAILLKESPLNGHRLVMNRYNYAVPQICSSYPPHWV